MSPFFSKGEDSVRRSVVVPLTQKAKKKYPDAKMQQKLFDIQKMAAIEQKEQEQKDLAKMLARYVVQELRKRGRPRKIR